MLKHCLACSREFPSNSEFEFARVGRRMAFDPLRGRLWLICGWCAHWSLVPMEARWEAVEELERRARGRAVVVRSTDQVSLLALGRVEAVRVGPAPAREEAWWRYGRTMRGRRLRYSLVTRTGGTLAAAAVTAGAVAMGLVTPEIMALKWRSVRQAPGSAYRSGTEAAESLERWFRYGSTAWRGAVPCDRCGGVLDALPFEERGRAMLHPDGSVRIYCRRCRSGAGWHVLHGSDAEHVVRRVLAYENIAGADDRQLDAATALIRTGGLRIAEPMSLRRSPREALIGLELLVAEQAEARVLGWELAELQARWEMAEELACINDRELTP